MKLPRLVVGSLSLVSALLIWNFITMFFIQSKPATLVDKEIGQIYRPGSIYVHGTEGFGRLEIDSKGFNNNPMSLPVDVLVLGDSTTEALQVDRSVNYVSQTQKMLERKVKSIRMYNAGHSGLSVADYIAQASGYLGVFGPTTVVVQVTWSDFGGDAFDNSRSNYIKKDGPNFSLVHNDDTSLSAGQKFESFFTVLPLAKYSLKQLDDYVSQGPLGDRLPFIPREKKTKADSSNEKFDGSLVWWSISKLKESYGPKTIILLVRYAPRPGPDGIEYSDLQSELISTELAKACKEFGLKYVDTKESFIKLTKEEYRFPRGLFNYRPGGGHLNDSGHLAVSRALAPVIEESLDEF